MTTLADPSTFTITRHAALRILDMAIEPAEIRRALTRGRFHSHGTDPSSRSCGPPSTTGGPTRAGVRIAVAMAPETTATCVASGAERKAVR